ncbi:glycosyltransferase family 2 protein [Enterobacter asburiae]|uniref:glycosyltransferase n=1 Tax=Enterobacter asburiae TaxID=61645 RepID=UPI00192A964F|nr:glycosyltransferase family 2 protein [Enterobacter asburiae]MBL5942782.1 glycosyltransferase family 2 protein [Enterobacter asburiae]MBL5951696.1 glycosyltransferase family 2 protein [Enterobacter asburiae]
MRIVISVVSHNHFKIIKGLKSLEHLAPHFDVYLIDNVKEPGLKEWCQIHNINYLSNESKCGFGENNNKIFDAAFKNSINEDDWFLILNPDVVVNKDHIFELVERMRNDNVRLATVNLYKDTDFHTYDNAVRHFPTLSDFIKSYLTGANPTIIDKSQITEPTKVDWASGSFLMFQSGLYQKIGGFDKNYFMYCEDIDICLRSRALQKESVTFYPSVKALHFAAHSNRKLLSKSFFWHVRSMVRYLWVKNTMQNCL